MSAPAPPAPATARHRAPLLMILAVYFVLAALYALFTPPWQTPDEPAHFNYVRQVATRARLPVLRPADYDQAYLEEIKARHFPPDMPVEGIRYEGHQPPLYYWLAAPVYRLAEGLDVAGQVRVLRLFGVLLGAGVVALVWASARRLFPAHPLRAHVAAGFAAVLPMHLAMMAAVNNDALSELLIAAGMYRFLGHLKWPRARGQVWVISGLLVGLGLLAKFQAYILLPLAGLTWLWTVWVRRGEENWLRRGWQTGLAWLAPALLLPLPWWLRNLRLYGGGDFLGLQQHDAIVNGQPRTADWIASFGWSAYLDRLLEFTFQSFWGVFGWLGVFLDRRIYTLLAALTLLAVTGLIWRGRKGGIRALSGLSRPGLALLVLQVLIVGASYLWYNLSFVQHQGRYFFPALLPLAIFFALGLEGLYASGGSGAGAALLAALALLLAMIGLAAGNLPGWTLLILLAWALLLLVHSRWRRPFWGWWAGLTLAAVAGVALWALFGAIVPQLG